MKLSLLAIVFTLLATQAKSGFATPIVAGKTYKGKQTLQIPKERIRFTLPAGWSGSGSKDSKFFVMESQTSKKLVYVETRELTLAKAKKLMSETSALPTGNVLVPKGKLRIKGRRLSRPFQLLVSGNSLNGFVEIVLQKQGVGVFLAGFAKPGQNIKKAVRTVASSVRFYKPLRLRPTAPADKAWARKLRGKTLLRFYTTSGYHEKTTLALCTNGRFRRQFSSGGFTSGLGSGATQSKDAGTWTVSHKRLRIRYMDGTDASYTLSRNKNGLKLNGNRWYLKSKKC